MQIEQLHPVFAPAWNKHVAAVYFAQVATKLRTAQRVDQVAELTITPEWASIWADQVDPTLRPRVPPRWLRMICTFTLTMAATCLGFTETIASQRHAALWTTAFYLDHAASLLFVVCVLLNATVLCFKEKQR